MSLPIVNLLTHLTTSDTADKWTRRGVRGRRRPAGRRVSTAAPLTRADTMAEPRKFTRREIEGGDPREHTRFIIHNNVYDVSKFLDEHPGGHEVLVNVAGKDASEDFDDIGHSLDAKELMKKFQIGELVEEDKHEGQRPPQVNWSAASTSDETETSFFSSWKFPVVLGIVVTVLYSYLFG